MDKPVKVVAYLRASNSRNYRLINSLENQCDRIVDFANKNNMEILEVFDNFSNSKEELCLMEVLEYCKKNQSVTKLLITRYDRISRVMEDYLFWEMAFSHYKVEIIAITQFPDNSPTGQLLELISSAVESTKEQVRKGSISD